MVGLGRVVEKQVGGVSSGFNLAPGLDLVFCSEDHLENAVSV